MANNQAVLTDEEAQILKLMSAVRNPVGADLTGRLQELELFLLWVKRLFWLLFAVAAAIAHVELKIWKIDDNAQAVQEYRNSKARWDDAATKINETYPKTSEMWWMKENGISNPDLKNRGIQIPPGAGQGKP